MGMVFKHFNKQILKFLFFGQATHLSFIPCRWFFLVFKPSQTMQGLKKKGFGMVPAAVDIRIFQYTAAAKI